MANKHTPGDGGKWIWFDLYAYIAVAVTVTILNYLGVTP